MFICAEMHSRVEIPGVSGPIAKGLVGTAHRQTEEPQARNMVAKAGRGNCYSMGSIEQALIAWEIMASAWEKYPEAQV